jgi:hypothetical protein
LELLSPSFGQFGKEFINLFIFSKNQLFVSLILRIFLSPFYYFFPLTDLGLGSKRSMYIIVLFI